MPRLRTNWLCDYPDCGRPARSRQLCSSHGRQRAQGKELRPISQTRLCKFPGCDKKHEADGWCQGHRYQARTNGPMRPLGSYVQHTEICIHPHCSQMSIWRSACREHRVLATHHFSSERAGDLFTEPRCAICHSTENLRVDHDHACCPGGGSCGECIRGLLCNSCNLGLGWFQDDSDRLRNALDYVESARITPILPV